ncbi:MAG: flagellar hook-basal body complex protein FliE [Candidatus Eremiobacterota bacterium]
MTTLPAGGLEPLKLMEIRGNTYTDKTETSKEKTGSGFTGIIDLLSRGVNSVHDLQQKAKTSVEQVASGDGQNIHNVIIATQEASMAFQFALRTRNKVVEAYNEVMRMNV